MRCSRWTAAAGALVAVLVAGCATTIGGTAAPDPAGLAAVTTVSTSPVTTSSGTSTTADTSGSTTAATASSGSLPSSSGDTSTSASTESSTETSASQSVPTSSADSSTSGSSPQQAYPTTPLKFNRTPSTQASANLLEARRIASALVVPTFIDPTYTRGGNLSTVPLKGPSAMSILFTAPVPSVAQRAGMITGFSSVRSAGDNAMLVAAFEFGTAAQATAAVPALAAASANKDSDKGKAVVAGYPAAAGRYGSIPESGAYFQSFLAQGRLVLYLYLDGKQQTAAQQAALAAKVFKVESAAMAGFKPTAPTALMQLLVDPEGMLARTLPNVGDESSVRDGFMTAAGQLHYDTDPAATKTLFAGAGVDAVADGRASLYRAKDEAGAAAVRDRFVELVRKAESLQSYTLTAKVPDAQCLQEALNSVYYCVGTRGRYAFEIQADSEADLNAAMDAQYRLLDGF